MDWRDFPLPDGGYSDDTRPWTSQDLVNYLPTFAEMAGTRSRLKLACVPGLRTVATVGAGPYRGMRDVEGSFFVVSGTKLYRIGLDLVATELGTIPGTGRVSMTHNQVAGGNQLLIGTGSNSYVWDTTTSTLTANGVPLLSVDFLNQLNLGVDVQRRFWRYSGLADAKTWNTLDNESAESSPDRIAGGIVSQGEWLVFGERTIEAWQNNPNEDTAFTRGAVIEKGCANANTICRLDNTVFFLGNDLIVYRLNGYQPVPVSTKAQADAFRDCDPAKAFAFTYEDRGYVIYYLTFQDGRTWGYDVTSQRWHRRESFGLDRWRLDTLTKWDGEWYGGDYASGRLYKLEWGYAYEGCEIMPRRIRSGVMHGDGNPLRVHALKMLVNTGTAPGDPQIAAPSISGSMPDSYVGNEIDFTYTITRSYPGQVFIILAEGLPDGLSIDGSGHVTGTLTTAGTFNVSLSVTDDCGNVTTYLDAVTISDVVMPAQQSWRYLQIAADDATDYSATDFDDSGWSVGTAPFGSLEDGSATGVPAATAYDSRFATNFATNWTTNTRLWLRRTLTLSEVPDSFTIRAFIEDNFHVYVNGALVATSPSDPVSGGQEFAVATTHLVAGNNVIAICCDDEAPVPAVSTVYVDLLLESP